MFKHIRMLMVALLLLVPFAGGFCPVMGEEEKPAGEAQDDEEQWKAEIVRHPYDLESRTVIGNPRWHTVQPNETMLDIARMYGLGFNELERLYPHTDPWLPPTVKRMLIPTFWVLPTTQYRQLVINLPELRLYFFDYDGTTVQTFPIGIGDEGWETPVGSYRIVEKREHPTWYIPESLQEKYQKKTIPPGPENPLGNYFMRLSARSYGIHGTNMPWGVGRLVSHGCIRCYPEHIELLYPQVKVGTRLEIIYEPVKIGIREGQVFVEAHPDVYGRLQDYRLHAWEMLKQLPYANRVDIGRFDVALKLQNGVPTDVTQTMNFDKTLGAN